MGNDLALPADPALQKAVDYTITQEARKRASAEPLPADVADIWCGQDEIEVSGFKLRRPKAGDWLIFRKLDSPFVRFMLEMQKTENLREKVDIQEEEEAEILFQFTHTASECWSLLKGKEGRDNFRAAALTYVGTMNLTDYSSVMEAIWKSLFENSSSKISYSSGEPAEKKT